MIQDIEGFLGGLMNEEIMVYIINIGGIHSSIWRKYVKEILKFNSEYVQVKINLKKYI